MAAPVSSHSSAGTGSPVVRSMDLPPHFGVMITVRYHLLTEILFHKIHFQPASHSSKTPEHQVKLLALLHMLLGKLIVSVWFRRCRGWHQLPTGPSVPLSVLKSQIRLEGLLCPLFLPYDLLLLPSGFRCLLCRSYAVGDGRYTHSIAENPIFLTWVFLHDEGRHCPADDTR